MQKDIFLLQRRIRENEQVKRSYTNNRLWSAIEQAGWLMVTPEELYLLGKVNCGRDFLCEIRDWTARYSKIGADKLGIPIESEFFIEVCDRNRIILSTLRAADDLGLERTFMYWLREDEMRNFIKEHEDMESFRKGTGFINFLYNQCLIPKI